MKEITQKDIEKVKCELAKKRKEFDELTFTDLEEQLKWIREFFNEYTADGMIMATPTGSRDNLTLSS